MADIPIKYGVEVEGVDEAKRQFESLNEEVGEGTEATAQGSESWANMAGKVALATAAIGAAIGTISAVTSKLVEFGREWERMAGVINRFNGNIEEAKRRTNGLITDFELMKKQSQLLAAGLQVTDEQFATMVVRANEFAAQVDGDFSAAFDKLRMAITMGSAEPLREFGIVIQGVTDKSEIQRRALQELQRTWGSAQSSADTLGGQIQVMETRMENAKLEFYEAITSVQSLNTEFGRMEDSITRMAQAMGLLGTESALSPMQQFGAVVSGVLTTVMRQIRGVSEAITAISRGDFREAVSHLTEAWAQGGNLADNIRQAGAEVRMGDIRRQQREALSTVQRQQGLGPSRRPGAGGRGGTPTDPLEALMGGSPDTLAGLGRGVLGSLGEMSVPDLDGATSQVAISKDEEMRNAEAIRREREKHLKRVLGLHSDITEEVETMNLGLEASNAGMDLFANLATGAFDAINRGQELSIQSLTILLDQWLAGFAIQETFKGAAALAEYIGSYFTNIPKLEESAQHFALAALAGGASLAIPSGGGGGGSASQPANDNARPGSQRSANDNGGSNVTVVINSYAPIFETRAAAGRGVRQAMEHERRRY